MNEARFGRVVIQFAMLLTSGDSNGLEPGYQWEQGSAGRYEGEEVLLDWE